MRTSGIIPVLASLFICPVLRAESRGPEATKSLAAPGASAKPGAAPEAAAKPDVGRAATAKSASGPTTTMASSGKFADAGGCVIAGIATPDIDLQLVDIEGRALARFGGVPIPLALSDLPERADGKVKVTTGGHGRLRLSGLLPLRSVPIYLKQDVPFIKGHVTLTRGASVTYTGRSGDLIRISVKAADAVSETYNTTVSCDLLSLEQHKATQWSPPGHARGYLMKQTVAPLFDKADADANPVTTIKRASDAHSILFFGDRREGDFIHVLYHRDVNIEGWMAARDLEILPRGEIADHSQSKYVPPADRRLTLKADGTLYRIEGDVALYGKADPKLPPIGVVTKDTELYVLDVVVGWVKVLPKHLDVVPLPERNFWVKASEIGI